jgi:hypothetical protein
VQVTPRLLAPKEKSLGDERKKCAACPGEEGPLKKEEKKKKKGRKKRKNPPSGGYQSRRPRIKVEFGPSTPPPPKPNPRYHAPLTPSPDPRAFRQPADGLLDFSRATSGSSDDREADRLLYYAIASAF